MQGKVEGGANFMLHFSVEVDEDVPTGDEVDARKWRVLQKAVLGEQDDVAQFARHRKWSPSRVKNRRNRSSVMSASIATG